MGLKIFIRDSIPLAYQVPIKYWFNALDGTHEPELKLLKYIINKGDRAIDVGGNRGAYAYKLHSLGAVVDVFEPNPACSRILSAWSSGVDDVIIHPCALSDANGTSVLHIPVDTSGVEHDASASLEDKTFQSVHEQSVQLRTLDSFAFDSVQFIKIDVEGHESKLIQGAVNTIKQLKPALLIEIEQRHLCQPIAEVFNSILIFGYKGFFYKSGKLFRIEEFNPLQDQDFEKSVNGGQEYINNFIFVHPGTVNKNFMTLLGKSGLTL